MRSRVAAQALGIHLFGRGLGGIEDLGHVAAAHPRAPCPRRGSSRRSRRRCRASGPFWCADWWRNLLATSVVAGGAGIGAHKIAAALRPWPAPWPASPRAPEPPAWETHNIPAPSNNIKQARSPGLLPGAAPIGNCVTGPFLCIKYRLGCSHSRFRIQQARHPAAQNGKVPFGKPDPAAGLSVTFSRRRSLCGASPHASKTPISSGRNW